MIHQSQTFGSSQLIFVSCKTGKEARLDRDLFVLYLGNFQIVLRSSTTFVLMRYFFYYKLKFSLLNNI